jgi:cell division protein FtsB
MGEIGRKEAIKKLGISDWSLRSWERESGATKKAERVEKSSKLTTENRELQEKIKELEKEVARIKKENEFLEEAARFFAVSRQK